MTTGVILVCRMSSSRLPGKTLKDFGGHSMLEHIVGRVEKAGVERSRIVICTSTAEDDAAIVAAAEKLGCKSHAGSLDNVSQRIIDAARAHDLDGFGLVLGDNPWIDPEQIAAVMALGDGGESYDYIVTATGELAYQPDDEPFFPIGTRIQYIRTAFMEERLAELDDAVVREHTSKLFSLLPAGTRYRALYSADGRPKDQVGELNISINTAEDYARALAVLERVGNADAPTREIVSLYLDGRAG